MQTIDFISQPWHWSVSGAMIVLVMFLLIFLGQKFGISTSFRTVCTIAGGRRLADYFNYDWKIHTWLLLFVAGTIIGGTVASTVLASPQPVQISDETVEDLAEIGVQTPQTLDEGTGMIPTDLFNFEMLSTPAGLILLVLGGILIGFGTRWAGGCTSGHAITGLANLQLPSLVAVIGFFIGGLTTTFLLLPWILSL